MAVPPVLVESLVALALSEKNRDLVLRAGAGIWARIFKRDTAADEITDGNKDRDIERLIADLPSQEEMAAAFAALEASVSAMVLQESKKIRRLVLQAGAALLLVQTGTLVLLLTT